MSCVSKIKEDGIRATGAGIQGVVTRGEEQHVHECTRWPLRGKKEKEKKKQLPTMHVCSNAVLQDVSQGSTLPRGLTWALQWTPVQLTQHSHNKQPVRGGAAEQGSKASSQQQLRQHHHLHHQQQQQQQIHVLLPFAAIGQIRRVLVPPGGQTSQLHLHLRHHDQ